MSVQEREGHPLLAISVERADLAVAAALVPAPAGAEFGTNSAYLSSPASLEAAMTASVKEKAGRTEAVVELVVVEAVAEVQRSPAPSQVALAHPCAGLLIDFAGHWSRQAKQEL